MEGEKGEDRIEKRKGRKEREKDCKGEGNVLECGRDENQG